MKDLKTTIIGAIAGGAYAALAIWQTGEVDLKTIAITFGFAVLGYFAKDTGSGTTPTVVAPKNPRPGGN